MKLLKTALFAIFFGSLYTIFRKYQSAIDLEKGEPFNQPLYHYQLFSLQSFIIFIGMSSIALFKPSD